MTRIPCVMVDSLIPRVVGRFTAVVFRVARARIGLAAVHRPRPGLVVDAKGPPRGIKSSPRRETRTSRRDPSLFRVVSAATDRFTIKHLLSDGRVKLKMLQEMVGFAA